MNIVFSEGGNVLIDFEIAKDSHVYFDNGVIDFYRKGKNFRLRTEKNS